MHLIPVKFIEIQLGQNSDQPYMIIYKFDLTRRVMKCNSQHCNVHAYYNDIQNKTQHSDNL